MKMKKLSTVLALGALTLSVVMTGCSSKDSKEDSGAKTETAVEENHTEKENSLEESKTDPDEKEEKRIEENSDNSVEAERETGDADEEVRTVAEGDDQAALNASFIENVGGNYRYKPNDEIEYRNFEIRMIDGNIYIEYIGGYMYGAAEIEVKKESAVRGFGDMEYEVTMHPFSGFSYAGNYQGVGNNCKIRTTNKGIEIDNNPFLEERTLVLEKADFILHKSEAEAQSNTTVREIWGSWRCISKRDGETHYIYLEFTPEGKFLAVDKEEEFPSNVYIGSYTAKRTPQGITGDIWTEELAYAEMPYEWKLGYDEKLQCPVVTEDYSGAEPFTFKEGETLPFKKTQAGKGPAIKPGPYKNSSENKHVPTNEQVKALEEAIVIFPIGLERRKSGDMIYPADVVTSWAVLTDMPKEYAGLTFEKGEGKTPIVLDYPTTGIGKKANYIRTDRAKLEKALQGFFDEDIDVYKGEFYDYVIDDNYLTVWGDGYITSYEGYSDSWFYFRDFIDGDNLIIKASRSCSSINTFTYYEYEFTFEYNEESPYNYSLSDFVITNEDRNINYSLDALKGFENEIRNYVNNEADSSDKLELRAGVDGCDYARMYCYSGDTLVFAYYYNSKTGDVDNRYYFWDGCMIEWIEGNGNNDNNRVRHYASDNPLDYRWKDTQMRILKEAAAYR